MFKNARTQARTCLGGTQNSNVKVGLHQASALNPYMFDLILDVLNPERVKATLWDTPFADDIVLIDSAEEEVERDLEREDRGHRISRKKADYMVPKAEEAGEDVRLLGEKFTRTNTFNCLGSHMSSDGTMAQEISHRIQSGWRSWRNVSCVLCNKNVNVRMKETLRRAVMRPAVVYGIET
ncbi:uncharacterized protein LOC134772339 [Penaeus indicus]|uniref:uncharacterized protein LOC134772339 n=1 Tax=Penaeus indicus TaxID=29960 RepID=UPI00300DB114